MPKIKSSHELTNIKDPGAFQQKASEFLDEVGDIINGKIEFDKNMLTQTVSAVFTAANTDLAVTHSLAKTGLKYIPCSKTVAMDIYHGDASDTSNVIYLKSSVVGTASIILF